MSTVLDMVARARDTGDFGPFVDAIPYARFLGLSASLEGNELLCKMAFADQLIGNPALPALHGGTVAALLESAAIFQLLWASETLSVPKTITITVDYLRSARPVDTFAAGRIAKHGRRVVSVHCDAWQDDRARPVASAKALFLVNPP